MIYTDMTKKAMNICYKAHQGSFDKGGVPYVFHPIHLAEAMEDELSTCVALLHDVVEDTAYTLEDLKKEKFPDEVIDAVDAISKRVEEDYFEYILRVKCNKLAKLVKLADIEHNTDESRLTKVDEKSKLKRERYEMAKRILEDD